MKKPHGTILGALLAILMFSAVATATASAHEYVVEGKAITGPVNAVLTGGSGDIEYTIGGVKTKIECKVFTTSSLDLTFYTKGESSETFALKECKMTKPPECKITAAEEHEMLFKESVAKLVTFGGGLGEEYTPRAGTKAPFFGFVIEGKENGCVWAEVGKGTSWEVGGALTCEVVQAGEEKVEHELVCTEKSSNLHIGTNRVFVIGTGKLKLVSGKMWSAK